MRISDWSSDVCSSDLAPSGSSLHRIINGPVGSVQPAFAGSSYDLPPAAGGPTDAAVTPAFAAPYSRRLARDPTVGPMRLTVLLLLDVGLVVARVATARNASAPSPVARKTAEPGVRHPHYG